MWFGGILYHGQAIRLKTPEMVKICPKCGSTHVYWVAGGLIGAIYRCNDCGYEGTFVLEVKPADLERFQKELKSNADGPDEF